MSKPFPSRVPELSDPAFNDLNNALDRTVHHYLTRGYRAGEIYKLLDPRTHTELCSVSGLVRFMNANLDQLDLDTVLVNIPMQEGKGPPDGLISVFFSMNDEPTELREVVRSVNEPRRSIREIVGRGESQPFKPHASPGDSGLGKAQAPRMYAGQ